MLTTLSLNNFIFIEHMDLHFKSKMTAVTGETGSGKSILCDALGFVLGVSSQKNIIQTNKSYCCIEATFEVTNLFKVQQWMRENDYLMDDSQKKYALYCVVKRTISSKGRTQAWINQKPAKVKDLEWLRTHLITRHSQHEQQKLLLFEYQRAYLDRYGQHEHLLHAVQKFYTECQMLEKQKEVLCGTIEQQQTQLELLQYQLDEIEKADVQTNELEVLTQKQHQLFYAHQVLEQGHKVLSLLREAEPTHVMRLLQTVQQLMQQVTHLDDRFQPVSYAIERAYLELTEAESDLQIGLSDVKVNPIELNQVEERLATLHRLSRKYHVDIEQLPALSDRLKKEYESYDENKAKLAHCEQQLIVCIQNYEEAADQLTLARRKSATHLEEAVTEKIQSLGMSGGAFRIKLALLENRRTRFGKERVTYYLSGSLGQPFKRLTEGVSGGELSRLSLVIHFLSAQDHEVPTLIFDEVDVGVGGSVAERIGHLLHELSHTKQVFCITHLAQVAVLANNHYCIQKRTQVNQTVTCAVTLDNKEDRIQEIARMLGGIYITDKTIAYAKSMLQLD